MLGRDHMASGQVNGGLTIFLSRKLGELEFTDNGRQQHCVTLIRSNQAPAKPRKCWTPNLRQMPLPTRSSSRMPSRRYCRQH